MTHGNVDIQVPILARVEGEGALRVIVSDGVVDDVRLEIYEAPRFFESFLRGRDFREPVDITARICGICPVAYQMSSAHAMERLAGVSVGGQIRELRRLLYCGEWIESHVLHIAFLHAPDFLGYPSGMDIAVDHPDLVVQALELKKFGNDIMEVVGGRPIHPVNVKVGGFYRAPTTDDLAPLRDRLVWAREAAETLVRWTAGFDFPELHIDHELVSLRHPTEYAICEGRLVSDRGLDIDIAEFEEHFEEHHVPHSTALHGRRISGESYLTGPLARWANNHDLLPPAVQDLATEVGIGAVERNPFRSIVVRSLETLYAVMEAGRIIDAYVRPDAPAVAVDPPAGIGHGCTEAPRGSLYHRYEVDRDGLILTAKIVPPTSQNQPSIEADVKRLVEQFLTDANGPLTPDLIDQLRHHSEMAIRNYDPCISCATHFLTVTVQGPPDQLSA